MRSQEDSAAGEAPSSSSSSSCHVLEGWQQTADARRYVNALLKRNKRKTFGVLERPMLDQYNSTPLLHRRLLLMGRAGVGKTSTVNHLLGRDVSPNHIETLGIQTSTIFWPAKLVSPQVVVLVELELWDVGERGRGRFDHILPTCRQATDGVAFFFSYADRHSWEDLPRLISSTVGDDQDTFKLVIGTHADSPQREVTEAEVLHFQTSSSSSSSSSSSPSSSSPHRQLAVLPTSSSSSSSSPHRQLAVLPTANTSCPRLRDDPSTPDGRAGINAVTPFMNALTQILLSHERSRRQPGGEGGSLEDLLGSLTPDTESPSQ